MLAPLVVYPFIYFYPDVLARWFPPIEPFLVFPSSLFIIVPWTTAVWLAVTYLTAPTDEKTLHAFYERIHPGGILWKPVADQLPHVQSDSGYQRLLLDWFLGCLMVLTALFGVGHLILGEPGRGLLFLLLTAGCSVAIYRHLSTIGWEQVGE
jgi:hypothetical protein